MQQLPYVNTENLNDLPNVIQIVFKEREREK